MSDSSGTAADLWSLLNWQPNEQQLILFRRLQTLLKTWNNRVNPPGFKQIELAKP